MRDGGELPEEFVYCCDSVAPDEKTVLEGLEQVCCGEDRPTANLASYDSLAEMIYLLLGKLGLRVPEDISLLGFGDTRRNGAVIGRLTSITVDEAQIGRRAAILLDEMRKGERDLYDTEQIVMPLGLSDGRTLGPAPDVPDRHRLAAIEAS